MSPVHRASGLVGGGLVLAAAFALWHVVAQSGWIPRLFFPEPAAVWAAMSAPSSRTRLLNDLVLTAGRMGAGFFSAGLLGIALGVWIGTSRTATRALGPTLEFLRILPASAVLPLFVMGLGMTTTMSVAVIAFGALWPVLLSTMQGVRSIEPRLIEVANTLELSGWQRLRWLILPAALPDMLAGLRVALAFSLILAVVAEMLTSLPGLGLWILKASRSFRSADLFAGIAVLGLMGLLTNTVLDAIERWARRWQPRSAGASL
jgi:ABC-type nitrate/sulfonate/bicarbonate transport system permease component